MIFTIPRVSDFSGGETNFGETIDSPDTCPQCHHAIQPRFIAAYLVQNARGGDIMRLEVVFACPRKSCQRLFISRYDPSRTVAGVWRFDLRDSVPATMVEKAFPETVNDTSPEFAAIYNQSYRAEQDGLDLICGAGYRRALEFLVKDYAKKKHQGQDEEIEKKFLGSCIAHYIDHPRVKIIAERATWLGNDETHYVRKWEDKDLQDLKKLIELTTHWITMDLLSAEVVKDMPDPKSKA
jgi:hypothetical protein